MAIFAAGVALIKIIFLEKSLASKAATQDKFRSLVMNKFSADEFGFDHVNDVTLANDFDFVKVDIGREFESVAIEPKSPEIWKTHRFGLCCVFFVQP